MQLKKDAVVGSILTVSVVSLWIQLYLLVYRDEIDRARALSVVQTATNPTNEILRASRVKAAQLRPSAAISGSGIHLSKNLTQPVDFQTMEEANSSEVNSINSSLSIKFPQTVKDVRLQAPGPDILLPEKNNTSLILQSKSQNLLEVEGPGIQNHLTHLRGKTGYLTPFVRVSRNRTGVNLVIGIPTIKRSVVNYLPDTLTSLFRNLSPYDAKQCLVIVFIGEPWDHEYVNETITMLTKRFSHELESGLLEVLVPKSEFYPDLESVKLSLNDPKERVKWRTKQNLDYAYLMLHASIRGQLYIQLEDDIITKPKFYSYIMGAVAKQKPDWIVLQFSTLGFIGKLLRTSDLPLVVEFLLMFHADKPGDWLLEDMLTTKICPRVVWKECQRMKATVAKDIKPALFQHIGYHSSLKGKIQKLKEKSFKAQDVLPGHKHTLVQNAPLHSTYTTIKVYQRHFLEQVYTGNGFFWGLTPKAGDHIDFFYEPPIRLIGFKIVSGSPIHPNDKFMPDTTVDVVPVTSSSQNGKNASKFITIGKFQTDGVARGLMPSSVGAIRALRISVHSQHLAWLIISQIIIHGA